MNRSRDGLTFDWVDAEPSEKAADSAAPGEEAKEANANS
jgi:hypothetical protein